MRGIKYAFDALEARGVAHRFIVYGSCAGADHALSYMDRDARVVGIVGIDPPALERTRRYYLIRLVRALRRPRVWLRLLTGRYGVLARVSALAVSRARNEVLQGQDTLQNADLSTRFEAAAGRGIHFLLVITSFGATRYNYHTQLFDLFPGLGLEDLATVRMLTSAEHTFSTEVARRLLLAEVIPWLSGLESKT